MSTSTRVVRGCGERIAGGAYLVCPTSPVGHIIECLLLDPPKPVEPDAIGLSPIGQTLVEDGKGVRHILDWVGTSNYAFVADFVEEARRFGVSRRVSSTMDFTLLSPQSRMLLVHSRAICLNADQYWAGVPTGQRHECPATVAQAHCGRSIGKAHPPSEGECAGLWWHDPLPDTPGLDAFYRSIGSTTYKAGPPSKAEPHFACGIFMRASVVRIEVVRDFEGKTHERVAEHASKGKLPVVICDD